MQHYYAYGIVRGWVGLVLGEILGFDLIWVHFLKCAVWEINCIVKLRIKLLMTYVGSTCLREFFFETKFVHLSRNHVEILTFFLLTTASSIQMWYLKH